MKIWYSFLIGLSFLSLPSAPLIAQCTDQVTHTSGSAMVAGVNVTVSLVGNACNWTTYCPGVTQPFMVGYMPGPGSGPGSFTFNFSPPISGIRLNFSGASNSGASVEEVRLHINGAHYPMASAGTANGCDAMAVLTGAGNLTGCAGCGVSGWANTNISGFPISTLTVEDFVVGGTPNGSLFSLWICPAALPVEWLTFSAAAQEGKSVQLEWTTFHEINNDYFAVERSLDGKSWESLKEMRGAGTSELPQGYSFTDEIAPVGLLYYRIRQTDLSGAFSYSEIRSVKMLHQQELVISPNPAHNVVYLEMWGIEEAQVRLMNNLGKELEVPFTKEPGKVTFETSSLPSGIYYVEVKTQDTVVSKIILVE